MRTIAIALLLAASPALHAAPGMWTLDNLPKEEMARLYGFEPDQAWLDHAMRSAARLAGGCSGSFVSAEGLVLTNHHCVMGCVSNLSSKENDYLNKGFLANTREEEKVCPGTEINRLEAITDVTARVREATFGLTGKAYIDAKNAMEAKIASECVGEDAANTRCDIVNLYQGGIQHLYRYTRFSDVRLVFAPEYAAGFFGGDPDNFNFPRYNLDMSLLRVYADGKPAQTKDHFTINPKGAAEGELVMTLGHPGSTQRLLTVAQLETQRDASLAQRLFSSYELRGLLWRFSGENAENARIAQSALMGVENGIKSSVGRLQALVDPLVMDEKRRAEEELKAFVAADAARAERYGDPWSEIEAAQVVARNLAPEYGSIEAGGTFMSQHLGWARTLVRGAAERTKPNEERLPEYTDAALPRVNASLFAQTPLYPEYEKIKLQWSLEKLRERLTADNAFVREMLAIQSPSQLAASIVEGSKLGDVAVRKALWEGGQAAIDASDDPAIVLMRRIDPTARALRSRMETEVESVERRAAERLAQARFEQKGTSVYPDATFSLRLSHGVIRGWEERGNPVSPFTQVAGLYQRATGYAPYKLADSWLKAKGKLDATARFNQVSTNDIIGGNSGSPLINAKGEVVGLIFDGNIHSLGGSYVYDERNNRAVSVHPAAMMEALKKVYGAQHLVKELQR